MKAFSIAVLAALLVAAFVWLREPARSPVAEDAGGVQETERSHKRAPVGEVDPGRPDRGEDAQSDSAIATGDGDAGIDPASAITAEGSIDQANALEVISTGNGQSLLDALRGQELTAEQSMRNAQYRAFIVGQQARANGRLTNNGLACGESICALSVTVNDARAWQPFQSEILESDDYPVYSVTEVALDEGQGAEHWLLFSVDPEVNRLSVRADP